MKIRSVVHKGLRRFIEHDDPSGVPPDAVVKLRNMVSFLQTMAHETELRRVPLWKAHQLTGDRKGTWGLSVTRNWRLTFQIDPAGVEIVDLDYVDYH
jgi:proteic killer suppression protein